MNCVGLRGKKGAAGCIGSTHITTDPPSSFLLHKLRIRDNSIHRCTGDSDSQTIYGRSALKDEFRAHSERMRPEYAFASVVRGRYVLCTPVKEKPEKDKSTAHEVRKPWRARRSDEIIEQCTQLRTVRHKHSSSLPVLIQEHTTSASRSNVQISRSGNRYLRELHSRSSDPSTLVLQFERNMRIHSKKVIGRSRSFLRQKL